MTPDKHSFLKKSDNETSLSGTVIGYGWYLAVALFVLWFFEPHNWLIFQKQAYEADYVSTCIYSGDFKSRVNGHERAIRYYQKSYENNEMSYEAFSNLSQLEKRAINELNLLGENTFCLEEFKEWETPFRNAKYSEIRRTIETKLTKMK